MRYYLAVLCYLSRRKDGKYFVYLSKELVEDEYFPFRLKKGQSIEVIVSFVVGDEKLTMRGSKAQVST